MAIRTSESTGPIIETNAGMVVPVARTRTLGFARTNVGLFTLTARPTKVDVIGVDGLEEVIPIRDRTRQIRFGIWLVVVLVVVFARRRSLK